MAKSELEQILEILSRAIMRETASYSYYFKEARDPALPRSVQGLLSQLSEEERVHRKLLLREYTAIQKGWGSDEKKRTQKGQITYLLPSSAEPVPLSRTGRIEIQSVSLPAKLVGGDNFIAREVRTPDRTVSGIFFTLYDVMGHGLETTRANSAAASVLGEFLDTSLSAEAEKEIFSPSKAVTHLNGIFSRDFAEKGVFLTLFAAFIDLEKDRLTYTVAGHEPPMIVRNGGKVDSLFNTQLLVGIDEGRKYQEDTVNFEKGESLCVFTDGILEAADGAGNFYGRERLRDVLSEAERMTASGILVETMQDLTDFCAGEPMKDELTLVVCKRIE